MDYKDDSRAVESFSLSEREMLAQVNLKNSQSILTPTRRAVPKYSTDIPDVVMVAPTIEEMLKADFERKMRYEKASQDVQNSVGGMVEEKKYGNPGGVLGKLSKPLDECEATNNKTYPVGSFDIDLAESVGFQLAVRAIYLLATKHLGPTHPVMKLILNMKA